MIDTPTLFILGAGASKPYKYPTGRELRTDIVKECLKNFDSLEGVQPQYAPLEVDTIRSGLERLVENFKGSSLTDLQQL